MEGLEFRTAADGCVYYSLANSQEKRLTKFSCDIVNYVIELVRLRFPKTLKRLQSLYEDSDPSERNFNIADRFIRCNFGADDRLSSDIIDDCLNFEEVKCPLRGKFCKDEGLICKPKGSVELSQVESNVAKLYVEGYTFKEIASILKKNPSTVKTQLWNIKNKLGVKNCRGIIKVIRSKNLQ